MTLVTPPFRVLAEKRREALGLADLSVAFFPHPLASRSDEEIEVLADQLLPEVTRMFLVAA